MLTLHFFAHDKMGTFVRRCRRDRYGGYRSVVGGQSDAGESDPVASCVSPARVMERLPFPDATFDKALAINSMQVWPDVRPALSEIRRVLKPAGTIALGFAVNSGQPKEGVAALLAAAGFAHARIVARPKLFCAIASKPTH
jgi:SAM-dependent methyltransferase